jgi:hypothetical protein
VPLSAAAAAAEIQQAHAAIVSKNVSGDRMVSPGTYVSLSRLN